MEKTSRMTGERRGRAGIWAGRALVLCVLTVFGICGVPVQVDAQDPVSVSNVAPDACENARLTSAVWHDVSLAYQGGQQIGVCAVWDVPAEEAVTVSGEMSYVLPVADVTDDQNEFIVWEYEKKSYGTSAGGTVEFYERVKQSEAASVTAYTKKEDGSGGFVSVAGVNPEHALAVVTTARQDMLMSGQEALDAYWHVYYTEGYAALHDHFLLEYYDYKKEQVTAGGQTVNVLTLASFNNDGLCNYPAAAMALGLGALDDSVTGSGYGKSPMPEELQKADFQLEEWNIPAVYTDPYDGLTYQVRLQENFDYEDDTIYSKSHPLFPLNAKSVTVDSGVQFPDDCSYLFSQPMGFSVQGDLSPVHGWVGTTWTATSGGYPSEYRQPTFGLTKSFKITGDKMADNVKNMSHMFRFKGESFGLTEFDISGLNTKNVTDMSHMFDVFLWSGEAMTGLSSISTANVTNCEEMFKLHVYGFGEVLKLSKEDLAGFDTSKVTNMAGMFADSEIASLDLSGFKFDNVTTMQNMFFRNFGLETLILPADANTAKVTDLSGMFQGCSNLKTIENLTALDTVSATTMANMFGRFYYKGSRPYAPMDYTGPCVAAVDLSGFQTGNVTDMSGMFCLPEVMALDVSGFDTSKVTAMKDMFDLPEVTALDVSALNTSKVTDMSGMFRLGKVKTLDVSTFDTSGVTLMGGMFQLASAQSLNLGAGFDVSKVESFYHMFVLDGMREFAVKLDVPAATSLSGMFSMKACTRLSVALTGTARVRNALSFETPKLVTLDLTGTEFGTKDMLSEGSFSECSSLVDLYLPEVLPDDWNSIPRFNAPFYLVGCEGDERFEADETFETMEKIAGDLSAYAKLKKEDGTAALDARSDRAVFPVENAVLLRVEETNPITAVSVGVYKRDENDNAIYHEDTGLYEYEDIDEVTLYCYDGVDTVDDSKVLKGYPNSLTVYAVGDPAKAYPVPNMIWTIREERADASLPVVTGLASQWGDTEYTILANGGAGTATLTLTAEGMMPVGNEAVQTFEDTLKVTVLPMVRTDSVSFENGAVTMKPGETKDNPAVAKNNSEKFAGMELTFPGMTYTSDNPSAVEVDAATGRLTAKETGMATIKAVSEDPAKPSAICTVYVTEAGATGGDDTSIEWCYLTGDGILMTREQLTAMQEGTDIIYESVACVGTKGTCEELKEKGTIRYDVETSTIVLSGFDEVNLSIFKIGVKLQLKGENHVRGYQSPAVDGLCVEGNCTMMADAGASLAVPKTAFVDKNGKLMLDSSVAKFEDTEDLVVFAGTKKETGETGETSTTEENETGKTDETATTEQVNGSQEAGTTEEKGTAGETGTTEEKGTAGESVTTEEKGTSGEAGTTEENGTTGEAGTTEEKGTAGESGTTEEKVTDVEAGTTEEKGTAGEAGTTEDKQAGTTEALKTEASKTEAPTESPKTEAPKTESPKTEAPKTEAPKTEQPKTEAPATQEAVQSKKNSPTKLNVANKKTYKLSKKVKVEDADGLKSVKLNGKSVALKKGNKKLTFKLSKYKRYLKKKGKWNKLLVVDLKGKRRSVQFKTK